MRQDALYAIGITLLLATTLFSFAGSTSAFPAYAQKEKKPCSYCHVNPKGGGRRTEAGKYFKANRLSLVGYVEPGAVGSSAPAPVAPALNFTVQDIQGKDIPLSQYQGKVLLIVNVASKCGNTPQYNSLQALYAKYKSQGLVVLGFPANDFGAQEPGNNKEIEAFCKETYKVTFPMFAKIAVKGDNKSPLYKFLTDKATNPTYGGEIEWNFAKFLIDRKGQIAGRFPARLDPAKPEVVRAIEALLAQKA